MVLEDNGKRRRKDVIYTEAFDRVNHCYLHGYLSRRVYSVQVGKEYSEIYYATSGVPQGSNIAHFY